MNAYVVFLMYLTAILGFVALTLILNRVLGPRPQNSPVKMEPFECGATPVGNVDVKAVPIKYYAVAIIFILFDSRRSSSSSGRWRRSRSPACWWPPSASSWPCWC